MTLLDVFISHSSLDVDVAEALVNLLRSALSIPAERIRCTSLNGYRLPAGAATEDELRQEVLGAATFIGLITPNSLRSTFVLFELGARWGAKLQVIPLLARGANTGDLQRPLSLLNSLSCDSSAQLYQLVDDMSQSLAVRAGTPASYQRLVEFVIRESRRIRFEVHQWIETDSKAIKIGLSSPVDKALVHETPIQACGRVKGLPDLEMGYRIQGFVVTNQEYAQDTGSINEDGYWRLQHIHLGATSHTVFFRIYDRKDKCVAQSERIHVIKEDLVV